ncbi:MAG: DASS family sodium-coupled anion symporter [Thermoanaerobaculia bacterium]|nr:DASS family sodium-coupled anion symporter [Thermoanaerobaculia bacterium]
MAQISDRPSPCPEGSLSAEEARFDRARRRLGLWLGPLAFALLLAFPPESLGSAAARLAAVVAWVLVWWITEAVPLPVTAVLGPALAVVLGVVPVREAFAPFGDPIIFLFLGSFLLARAMSAHGLDRRLARAVLSIPAASSSPARVVVAFAVLAASLSMWLSNSAATAMLYPIALGVVGSLAPGGERSPALTRAVLLACAYGASIGGIGTPVGSPPNLVAIGQISSLAGIRVGFVPWLLLALPLVIAMLVAALAVLAFRLRRLGGRNAPTAGAAHAGPAPGPMSLGERSVTAAFLLTVTLWVGPGILALLLGGDHPVAAALARALPEGVAAVRGASLLVLHPAGGGEGRRALTWGEAVEIDWGTLLLFGGGLSLGGAMFRTGLSEAVGQGLVSATGVSTTAGLTIVFTVFAIFFTEVTSNTAAATMLVPLAIAAAQAAGASPLEPALGCALGCSMAFMLPVATPPNAIVYGSGRVPLPAMVRAGFLLNLAACALIPAGVLLLVPLVFR